MVWKASEGFTTLTYIQDFSYVLLDFRTIPVDAVGMIHKLTFVREHRRRNPFFEVFQDLLNRGQLYFLELGIHSLFDTSNKISTTDPDDKPHQDIPSRLDSVIKI